MLIKDFKISGIQCDTEHCNYRNDLIQFEEYSNYLNSKCPVCGSNLLTQEDYNRCLFMYKLVNNINKIGNVLKWFNPVYYYRLITGKKEQVIQTVERFPKRKR